MIKKLVNKKQEIIKIFITSIVCAFAINLICAYFADMMKTKVLITGILILIIVLITFYITLKQPREFHQIKVVIPYFDNSIVPSQLWNYRISEQLNGHLFCIEKYLSKNVDYYKNKREKILQDILIFEVFRTLLFNIFTNSHKKEKYDNIVPTDVFKHNEIIDIYYKISDSDIDKSFDRIYDGCVFSIPKGVAIVENEKGFSVVDKKLKVDISINKNNYQCWQMDELYKYYIKPMSVSDDNTLKLRKDIMKNNKNNKSLGFYDKKDIKCNIYNIDVVIRVFDSMILLNKVENYDWLDCFLEELDNCFDFNQFLSKIRWDSILPILKYINTKDVL